MSCEWGNTDCTNEGNKCEMCVVKNFHYSPMKSKKTTQLAKRSNKAKETGRAGSVFEARNHQSNTDLLAGVTARMTPNSGAGSIKGDEEIRGIISIMEELKQENKTLAKGNKSFSIQLEWLRKLRREARAANKEFYYLKFSFGDEVPETFVVCDDEIIMSMVNTMVEDRKAKTRYELNAKTAERRAALKDAENTELHARIAYLESYIKELEFVKNVNQ